MTDIISKLAEYVVNTKYEDLPPESIAYAKKSILDMTGITIAGAGMPGCREVVDLIKDWGGKQESTIWVYGGKVPAVNAALANGTMGRALDLGDMNEYVGNHVSEYTFPQLLPAAEYKGKVSGKELITAQVLAQDLVLRVTETIGRPADSEIIPRFGNPTVFGATAGVTRLLGMDVTSTWEAMGLAFEEYQVAAMQKYIDGALAVRVGTGLHSAGAVRSALLARCGITGTKNVFEGDFNYYQHWGIDNYSLEPLTRNLGRYFEASRTSTKLGPNCKQTHAPVTATIDLVTEHDIKPEDIAEVDVAVDSKAYHLLCLPEEVKSNPKTVVDAQFSLPYGVAVAIVKRDVWIDDFTPQAIDNAVVRELLPKIKPRPDTEVLVPDNWVGGSRVTITTRDGARYSKLVSYAKGHPNNPITIEEMPERFRKCVAFSPRPFAERNIDELIELLLNLEQVDDVSSIVRLLVP
ncbi:MmgE/PrpD family protein [Chloroflexota bacterium]